MARVYNIMAKLNLGFMPVYANMAAKESQKPNWN